MRTNQQTRGIMAKKSNVRNRKKSNDAKEDTKETTSDADTLSSQVEEMIAEGGAEPESLSQWPAQLLNSTMR